ncbi:MAG: DNA polymerase III subunit delta [Deltaproteobacteria bacterium]|nr:MAG: DNA polymerase III subunit delta [Deltaproteobacteria bacterium]
MARGRESRIEEGRAFFRRLAKEGPWAPVFLITGEESFLRGVAVERLCASVEVNEFNRSVFRGGEAKGEDIVTAASMVPMLGDRRLVVVREVNALAAQDLGQVAAFVEAAAASTLLVLEGETLDGRQKAVQRIQRSPAVERIDFPRLYDREVCQWVARRAKGRGLVLAREVPPWLVEALGTQLGELDRALERIDLYLGAPDHEGRREVTLDLVQEVITETRARSVFELTDALSERDLGRSAVIIDEMLRRQESPIGAVTMIARQFRQLRLALAGRARGLRGRELASWCGCPPFRVQAVERAARAFSEHELEDILLRCAKADGLLKSSRLPDRLHLESLLLQICRPPRQQGS